MQLSLRLYTGYDYNKISHWLIWVKSIVVIIPEVSGSLFFSLEKQNKKLQFVLFWRYISKIVVQMYVYI